MLGLFAFNYVLLHLTSYVVLDHFFSWRDIWSDIVKRNFITVGMVNVVLLAPLAVTSTNAMVRRLGAPALAHACTGSSTSSASSASSTTT